MKKKQKLEKALANWKKMEEIEAQILACPFCKSKEKTNTEHLHLYCSHPTLKNVQKETSNMFGET